MKIAAVILLLAVWPLGLQAQTKDPAPQKSATNPSDPQVQAPTAASATNSTNGAASAKPIDPAKEAAIHRFLDAANVRKTTRETMDGTLGSARKMMLSALPPTDYRDQLIELFLAKFKSKMDMNLDRLLDSLLPVYDKYYTIEDLDTATKFYQTPAGKRVLELMPKILVESASIGSKWGEELGKQSMLEVLDEHPEIKKAVETGSAKLQQN